MAYTNLPAVYTEKIDGGLRILTTSSAPKVLVLGTSSKGFAETPYLVGRTQEAAVDFGTTGSLIRGMYEVSTAGAENIILFRIGATACTIEGLGVAATTGGIKIETDTKDDSVGTDYAMYFDATASAERLVVRNENTGITVFDRSWANTAATIDLGEVYVSGEPDGNGTDIGSASSFVTFANVGVGAVSYAVTYTAGTDGTGPSRMKLYELLFKAYKDLENTDFDLVVPVDIYLDDLNVVDLTSAQVTSRALTSLSDYPTEGDTDDVLGKFYAEEYGGEWYFWWWFPADPASPVFSGAQIYPSAGSADATHTCDGTVLTASDFHEVNFAYQLADFCYVNSENNVECHGFIGVLPPTTAALSDVNDWIGKLPTYVTDSNGNQTISSSAYNGTGLLGNKFMAGKYGFRSSVAGGGFILTDDHYLDGTEETDRGGSVIDIGAYISVVGAWGNIYNSYDTTGFGYTATVAPTYAGFVSTLPSKSAPTNKVLEAVGLPWRINNTKQDQLAGVKYVMLRERPKGVVVADAPTAAKSDSDYRRLTTVLIVKDVVDAIRAAADPFIGEPNTGAQRAALQTAIESALGKLQKGGYITRYDLNITATPAQIVEGDATIELTLVPAYELRQITLVLSLAAI